MIYGIDMSGWVGQALFFVVGLVTVLATLLFMRLVYAALDKWGPMPVGGSIIIATLWAALIIWCVAGYIRDTVFPDPCLDTITIGNLNGDPNCRWRH